MFPIFFMLNYGTSPVTWYSQSSLLFPRGTRPGQGNSTKEEIIVNPCSLSTRDKPLPWYMQFSLSKTREKKNDESRRKRAVDGDMSSKYNDNNADNNAKITAITNIQLKLPVLRGDDDGDEDGNSNRKLH